MRAVASLMSLFMAVGGCFPNNPKAQRYAKLTEGAFVLGGIGMLYFVNTGADCDAMQPGMPDSNCRGKATALGDIGLGLILAGLVGFIATVSTSEDDKPTSPTPAAVPKAEPTPPTPAPTPAPTEVPAEPPPVEPAQPPADPIPPPAGEPAPGT